MKSRIQRKDAALAKAYATIDVDGGDALDAHGNVGPSYDCNDVSAFLEAISDYFSAFDTTEHCCIAEVLDGIGERL